MPAMRRSLAPAVLCDITNTNSSRNSGKRAAVECVKGPSIGGIGNCPASDLAAGFVAVAGACCHPPERSLGYGESHVRTATVEYDRMDVDDEDALFADDPQSVAEYVQDIYHNLKRVESNFQPQPEYMDAQGDINARMRSILIDWLVEVHMKYKMHMETLLLAVNIIDRFLEKKHVTRKTLQLAGVASMLIASKFEEIHPPEVKEFVYISDNAYTKDAILKMEMTILITLNFQVSAPTMGHFLERYQRLNTCGEAHCHLMQYLVELTLLDHKMIRFSPSHVAAAATLLSNKLLKRHPAWPAVMVKHTKQTEPMIKDCAREICGLLDAAERSSLQAVRRKFSHTKFNCVGKMTF